MEQVKKILADIGLPRLIIFGFVIALFTVATVTGLDLAPLISDSLVRIGENGLFALAMVPTIQAGVGLNFGLPLGIVCGLLGGMISLEMGLKGFAGFFTAILISLPFSLLAGFLYAELLERVKGQEMMVGTYVGFSAVFIMCVVWLLAPFKSPIMIWAVGGSGLRTTITLWEHYGKILNSLWAFPIGRVVFPTGLLLTFLGACALFWVFLRTKTGLAMLAAGSNERYAVSSGINVRDMRRTSVILSTVMGGIGIVIYAQSFGFYQLYTAPLMMAFPAVAAVLIGGASVHKATITHVIIGTMLFQTLITISLPITSSVIQGPVSEVARIIISNGMILYALTRGTGGEEA